MTCRKGNDLLLNLAKSLSSATFSCRRSAFVQQSDLNVKTHLIQLAFPPLTLDICQIRLSELRSQYTFLLRVIAHGSLTSVPAALFPGFARPCVARSSSSISLLNSRMNSPAALCIPACLGRVLSRSSVVEGSKSSSNASDCNWA